MTHLEDFEDDCSPDQPNNTTNEVDTYLIASCGKSRVIIDGGGGDDPDPPSDAGGGVVVDQDDDGDPPDPPINPPGPRPFGGGGGGDGDSACQCYVYDFDIEESRTTTATTITFTKKITLYQKCHDYSTGDPENPPEQDSWILDVQNAIATGFTGNLDYEGWHAPCNCDGPCPTVVIVLSRTVDLGGPTTPGPSSPGRPDPINPTTPGDVLCCLWYCLNDVPTRTCKLPSEWQALTGKTTTKEWQCSDVAAAAPFVGTDGKRYTKTAEPCGGDPPNTAGPASPTTPGGGGGGGGGGGAPGVLDPTGGGVLYDVCYRWVCQNGTPVQVARTINYWRSFTGLNITKCSDLPATFTGPNEKLYSTNPAAVCPPGNVGDGVLIGGGGGGNGTPIGDPGGIAGGSIFDDGGGGGAGGGNTAIDDPGGIAGGGLFGGGGGAGGGNTAIDDPNFVAGDFDPFSGDGVDGGGIGVDGDPYGFGGGAADGTLFDPVDGGGGIKGSGTSLDIDPFSDSGQQFDTQNRVSAGDVADSYYQPTLTAFDRRNNIVFSNDPDRLAFLRAVGSNPLFSENSIFKRAVYRTLSTVLALTRDNKSAVYNGEEISAFCYDPAVIEDSLKESASNLINAISNSNSSSYKFSDYLLKGLRNAILRNVIGDYTLDFLREVGAGYGEINPEVRSDSIEVATGYIQQNRKSLYPRNYSKGESQRRVQMWRALPRDIDLKTSIGVSHGGNVCVRVEDTDDFTVSSRDGDVKQVATKNEFYTVIQQDGSEQTLSLYSKRKQAYAFDLPKLSVVHSLFAGRSGRYTINGDYNFILKTETPFEDDVEISGASTALKESYLIKLNKRSIQDVSSKQNFRQTSCVYDLVWKEGDSEDLFTSSVEDYYGPRQIVYVNGRDPFWNHFLAASSVSATYNDIKIDGLLGGIYPRVINTDILLVPTDQIRFDPYQGNSKLEQYETGKPVVRSLKIVTSPVQKSLSEVYAQLDFDTRRIARQGGRDNYAVKSVKAFAEGHFRKIASNNTTLRTDRSIVGRFINVINRVKDNYYLGGRGAGLSLPQRDLYSFMKPREVAEFLLRIPASVRNAIINGDFTGVRVFAVTNLDVEKTFLTPAREKVAGVNLDDERLFKEIQDLSSRYFKEIR